MNSVVRIGGIVLMASGALAMVLALLSLESLEGLTVDTGALLLAGGLVALGLSALTTAVETLRALVAGEELPLTELEQTGGLAPSFGDSMGAAAANPLMPRPKPQERQGRQERDMAPEVMPMSKASDDRVSAMNESSRPMIDSVVEEVHEFGVVSPGPQEAVSEEELFVVEERTIAGKPARILSDGTVEAETDDGWMRFENVEHLEEYMEALRSQHG
jgi:hypothetical protein